MWKIYESNKSSYQCVKQYRCLHSCSNPCTGWSRTFLRCSWADSDTWPPDERWGSSCRRSDTEVHRVLMVALQRRNSIIGKDFSKTRFFFHISIRWECVRTYRTVTAWGWVSPHMCRCWPRTCWDRYTPVHWGWADTATHTSSCHMGWSLRQRQTVEILKFWKVTVDKTINTHKND